MKEKLRELNLELNAEKTKIVDMREGKEGFDFLGFHFRQVLSWQYRKYYTRHWPKKSAVKKLKATLGKILGARNILYLPLGKVVGLVNPTLRGWMNYFKSGNSSKVFNAVDSFVHAHLALWWSKKHAKSGRRWATDLTYAKYIHCGVIRLTGNVAYWSKI